MFTCYLLIEGCKICLIMGLSLLYLQYFLSPMIVMDFKDFPMTTNQGVVTTQIDNKQN